MRFQYAFLALLLLAVATAHPQPRRDGPPDDFEPPFEHEHEEHHGHHHGIFHWVWDLFCPHPHHPPKPPPPSKKGDEAPKFCHHLECPEYDVLNTTIWFEKREYSAASWVSTTVSGMDYEHAVRKGFMRLFGYIRGYNEENTTIPMTAPVLTKIVPGAGPFCSSQFTVSFFVPFDLQDSPPEPKHDSVTVTKLSAMTVYVASFPGFAKQPQIMDIAVRLSSGLKEHGKDIVEDYFYFAGYDAPFRLFKRHNEVWIVAKEADDDDSVSVKQQAAAVHKAAVASLRQD